MKVSVLINPQSGRYSPKWQRSLEDLFLARGIEYAIFLELEALAQSFDHGSPEALLVVGGDGTFRDVISVLLDQKQDIPVALYPAGTANVLATEFGFSAPSMDGVLDAIAQNRSRKIDIYKAEDAYFVLGLSSGIDAMAVQNVSLVMKKTVGKWAYGLSLLPVLLNLKKIRFPLLTTPKPIPEIGC